MQPNRSNSEKRPADRLLKMPGKRPRPIDFKTRIAEHEGETWQLPPGTL